MATGGDIIEITYNHPTIGSGVIFPKAAEDNTYDLGGIRSTDDANMVDGGGNMIDQMNRGRWSVETLCVNDMNTQNEIERCNEMAASPALADWTFTHINGTVYVGKGKPVGDLQNNVNQSTFTLKVAGGGKLKKQ
jgi:hypothetical protein